MANAISLGASHHAGSSRHARHDEHGKGGSDFESLVNRSLQGQSAIAAARPGMGQLFAPSEASSTEQTSGKSQVQAPGASGASARSASAIGDTASSALDTAMDREGVPASWKDGLSYIMAQESGGQVGVKNPTASARGLFQLTAANYHYNPSGAGSFGNAVEEAQGGIRYIQDRYGTADNAVQFWQDHHWY